MGSLSNTIELSVQRSNTKRFIAADPTSIILNTDVKVWSKGTVRTAPGSVRAAQNFKVIWNGEDGVIRDISDTTAGARRFDFILVGEYDAEVAIGDFWEDGQQFVVEYIFPTNGWEVKAGGVSHGPAPR